MEGSPASSYLSERANKRIPMDMDYINNYSVVSALQNPFDQIQNPEVRISGPPVLT